MGSVMPGPLGVMLTSPGLRVNGIWLPPSWTSEVGSVALCALPVGLRAGRKYQLVWVGHLWMWLLSCETGETGPSDSWPERLGS